MALIVSLTVPATTALVDGAVVDVPEKHYPAAYARVLFARAHTDLTYISVVWYADEAARLAEAPTVKIFEYSAPTASLIGDIYPAAYAHLKTLADFAGAVDHPVADPIDVIVPVAQA